MSVCIQLFSRLQKESVTKNLDRQRSLTHTVPVHRVGTSSRVRTSSHGRTSSRVRTFERLREDQIKDLNKNPWICHIPDSLTVL